MHVNGICFKGPGLMIQRNLFVASFTHWVLGALSVGLLIVLSGSFVPSASSDETDGEAQSERGELLDSARVVGHTKCVDCHRSELAAWQRSKHSGKIFDYLLGDNGKKYAEKLDIPIDQITRTSLCVDCHATRSTNALGHARVIAGVSCEACHNPAGGEQGWLNLHAVYGPVGTRREAETAEHYEDRAERSQTAGQLRSTELYAMAKRCMNCHIVGSEALVNVAGHKLSGDRFELLRYMSGEVRHNFHLDQRQNAKVASLWSGSLKHPGRNSEAHMKAVFVVGLLVKAETVLRMLAGAEEPEDDYAEELAALLEETLDNIEDTDVDELADLADDSRDLCDRLLDGDFEAGDKEIIESANKFAKLARQFAAAEADDLEDVELPKLESDFEKAYQP